MQENEGIMKAVTSGIGSGKERSAVQEEGTVKGKRVIKLLGGQQ